MISLKLLKCISVNKKSSTFEFENKRKSLSEVLKSALNVILRKINIVRDDACSAWCVGNKSL